MVDRWKRILIQEDSNITIQFGALILIDYWNTINIKNIFYININSNIIFCIIDSFLFIIVFNITKLFIIKIETEINILFSNITK